MPRLSVLIAVLVGMVLAVPTINDPGLELQSHPWLTVPAGTIPDDEISGRGTSVVARTAEPDYLLTTGSPGRQELLDDAIGLRPFMDWGDDVLAVDMNGLPALGKLATDVEEDGTIWLAVLDPNGGATNDTIFHYSSTDGGATWTYWNYVAGASGDIRDFDLKVGSHGGAVQVYTFIVYDGVAGVYLRRLTPTDGSFDWTQIAAGDTWTEVSADRNIETPQHVFCGWVSQGGALKLASSSDGGATFGNERNVSSARRNPSVCAGGDGHVYIAYMSNADSTFWRVGRYTSNLISPTSVFANVDSSGTSRFYRVSIAAARTVPGGSQTAIVLSNYRHTAGNIGPRYGWTTNGGTSWSSSFWPVTNQARETWDARWPYIRVGYGESSIFRALVTMHEPTTNWDTLVYAYARNTAPTTWQGRAEPNDHRITGEFGGKVDYSSDVSGGYVLYREYSGTEVWVDRWNWTGVEEGGTPLSPGAFRTATFLARGGAVSLTLPSAARVRAVLYDGAGRRVREVFSGSLDAGQHRLPVAGLNHGIHFLELDINGTTRTAKLVTID